MSCYQGEGHATLSPRNGYTPFLELEARLRQVLVTCDICEAQFSPTLHERPIPDQRIRQYLQCPNCQSEIPVCEITQWGIELRTRLKRLEQLGQMRTPQYRNLRTAYQRQVRPLAPRETAVTTS